MFEKGTQTDYNCAFDVEFEVVVYSVEYLGRVVAFTDNFDLRLNFKHLTLSAELYFHQFLLWLRSGVQKFLKLVVH